MIPYETLMRAVRIGSERRYEESVMRAIAAAVTILVLSSSAALAQSPYAGMQTRPIKALSEQQIADWRPLFFACE